MPIYVCVVWPVAPDAAPLTNEAGGRLETYLMRYAQTLGVIIQDVEATSFRVTLLVELPSALSLDSVAVPLREASARFARETLKQTDFAWAEEGICADSIAAPTENAAGKTEAGVEIPAWLTEAIARSKGAEE